MNLFRNKYDIIFFGFLCSVVLVFFYLRPLDSSWNRLINGDGLGYYSYLPAKYIYQDANYEFKWFNPVFKKYYAPGTFPNPEDNLLVQYGDRKINKYYQGLSYLWLPFFAVAHNSAKAFGYAPDGFSQPYQLAIGLASLIYLLVGLVFLRKLLRKLFSNPYVENSVPLFIFYGTYLFNYSVYYNSLAHVYSFTLAILFIYFLLKFFSEEKKLANLLICILLLVLSACVRPLNGILIFLVPTFLPKGFFKKRFSFEKFKVVNGVIILLFLGAIFHQLGITKVQTGTFFPNTYNDETFHFERSVFLDALVSYRLGLFVYAPLILLSFLGFRSLGLRRASILFIFFFGVLFLYSAWWYWPIVKRAMIDFYVIPAIFLGALFNSLSTQRKRIVMSVIAFLCVLFFQLKNYQMSHGILDEFYTYKDLFWRNFFKVRPATVYLVDPSEVTKKKTELANFENQGSALISEVEHHDGKQALLLDSKNYAAELLRSPTPDWFTGPGHKKIRISLWLNASPEIQQVHLFLKLMDKKDKEIKEIPFYINKESIYANSWDYKEFGIDLTDDSELQNADFGLAILNIWNVENKNKFFVDEVKIEFFLTCSTHEIFK